MTKPSTMGVSVTSEGGVKVPQRKHNTFIIVHNAQWRGQYNHGDNTIMGTIQSWGQYNHGDNTIMGTTYFVHTIIMQPR